MEYNYNYAEAAQIEHELEAHFDCKRQEFENMINEHDFTSDYPNPYNIKGGDFVIANSDNFPLYEVWIVLNNTVVTVCNKNILLTECSPYVEIIYNGGFSKQRMSALEYDKARDNIAQFPSTLSLVA